MSSPKTGPNSRKPSRHSGSYARLGTCLGALAGLLVVWRIMGVIDPNVTEHKGIFPAAVIFLCLFAVIAFLVCLLIGRGIGVRTKRPLPGQTNLDDDE